MIKTVIFDIDDTLYSYEDAHRKAYEALLKVAEEEVGWTREEFERLHKETNEEIKERIGNVAAVHNRLVRYQNMLEKAGKPLYPYVLDLSRAYWDTFLPAMTENPGAKRVLTQLKEEGYRLGIVSNMTAWIQFEKLEKLNLLSLFDFVVTSEESRYEKPDPSIYAICREKSGTDPEDCLFVGDSLKNDVLAAREAGMKAVWLTTYVSENKRKAGEGERQISSFDGLYEFIKTTCI